MAEVRTKIYIVRENGNRADVQKFDLPVDSERGFYGTVEMKLQAGKLVTVAIPRQTFQVETINKSEWEKLFGKIEDRTGTTY